MEQSDSRAQFLESVDAKLQSPEDRAHKVWNIITSVPAFGNITDWDMLCFCANWIGLMSQGEWKWLEDDAKNLNRLIYTAHYLDRGTDEFKRSRRRDQHIVDDSGKEPEGKSIDNSFQPNKKGSPFE